MERSAPEWIGVSGEESSEQSGVECGVRAWVSGMQRLIKGP
jgi:hypothetical protein